MTHPVRHLGLLVFSFCLNGCVSVNLGNKDIAKSQTVRFKAPDRPYESIDLKSADKAWQSQNTGSTISYLSVCNDPSDPSLEALRDGTLRGIDNLNVEKESRWDFNAREALRTKATGRLDGVKIKIDLVTFKKNYCNYTLSLVGVESRFGSTDQQQFDRFVGEFTAP